MKNVIRKLPCVVNLYLKQAKMLHFLFIFSFYSFYKIGEQEGRTGSAVEGVEWCWYQWEEEGGGKRV
jgi:hypothetical protein